MLRVPVPPASAPALLRAAFDQNIASRGNEYVCRETGETFKALARFLAQDDMPPVGTEYGENIFEMNPLMLYAVERTASLLPGFNVSRAGTDAGSENYVVEAVDSHCVGGIEVRRYAILYKAPLSDG